MVESLEVRITALEEAVAALRERPEAALDPARFWLLDELRRRHPDPSVIFGGTAATPAGEAAWQWEAPADGVLAQDWEPAAAVLDALSHPVRLRLLQQVLSGRTSTAELAADESLGTTGQLHHHLRALVAAGWLASTGRGSWQVPTPRVIPLLVVVVATTPR